MIVRSSRLALACAFAALLTACGGSGAGGALPASTPVPGAGPSNISFVVQIPAIPVTSSARTMSGPRTMDFSAVTQSVKIAIGANVLVTANVSPTSSLCKPASGGGRSCTIGAKAPTGNDQFAITAYDQPNGAGNAIAQGTVAATVSSQASTVNVTVAGTIAKIALSLSNPYPPVGTATTANVVVTGYDTDGNAVLGAYPATVALSDSDTSGHTSLSATSITSSSTAVTLNYDGTMPYGSATITATLTGVGSVTATFAPSPAFLKTYAAPQVSFGPGQTGFPGVWNIARGPDGNMWVVATGYAEVIKVAPDGTMTQYQVPAGPNAGLQGIALGADGNLWFAETQNNAVAKITTSGTVTEYTIPSASGIAVPVCVGLGSDGNIWFFDGFNDEIGKVTPAGAVTEFPAPTGTSITAIVNGPDNNLWMSDSGNNVVLKVSTSGQVLASYPLSAKSEPWDIAAGPDGNLWVAEFGGNKIGRVTPSGTVTEFSPPTGSSQPIAITAGPDGRMWFAEMGTESGFGKIGYITTDGSQIRDFFGDGYHVHDLAFDANGTLWYLGLQQLAGFAPQEIGTFAY